MTSELTAIREEVERLELLRRSIPITYWDSDFIAYARTALPQLLAIATQLQDDLACECAARALVERELLALQTDSAQEITQLQAGVDHMNACRELLKVPETEVLYDAIAQLQAERDELKEDVAVLQSQVDNNDVTLEQVRMALKSNHKQELDAVKAERDKCVEALRLAVVQLGHIDAGYILGTKVKEALDVGIETLASISQPAGGDTK